MKASTLFVTIFETHYVKLSQMSPNALLSYMDSLIWKIFLFLHFCYFYFIFAWLTFRTLTVRQSHFDRTVSLSPLEIYSEGNKNSDTQD